MAFSGEEDISKMAFWTKVIPMLAEPVATKGQDPVSAWMEGQLKLRADYESGVARMQAQRAAPSGSELLSQGALFKSLLTAPERRSYLKYIKDKAYWGERRVDFVTLMEGHEVERKLQRSQAFQGGALKSWERHSLAVMDEVSKL